MGYVLADVRKARAAVLEPLAAVLRQRGVKRQWFADQMGISFSSLWNYLNGYDRLPTDFMQRACQVLGIPASFFPIPEPRDLYIQRPRPAKAPAKSAAKTGKKQPRKASAKSTKTTAKRTAN